MHGVWTTVTAAYDAFPSHAIPGKKSVSWQMVVGAWASAATFSFPPPQAVFMGYNRAVGCGADGRSICAREYITNGK